MWEALVHRVKGPPGLKSKTGHKMGNLALGQRATQMQVVKCLLKEKGIKVQMPELGKFGLRSIVQLNLRFPVVLI